MTSFDIRVLLVAFFYTDKDAQIRRACKSARWHSHGKLCLLCTNAYLPHEIQLAWAEVGSSPVSESFSLLVRAYTCHLDSNPFCRV